MSTGFNLERMTCKIGKKADKSDCAKKDCDNCRHARRARRRSMKVKYNID